MNQLLTALRFYATGTFQLVVGDTFAVHKSTVCRIVHRVSRAVGSLRDKYIQFPATTEECHEIMRLFYSTSGLPGIIGAIDCTHVAIQSPGTDDAEIYRNRKGYFSLNVQLVCGDSVGYISNVVARWPGSVHDSTIFDNCTLRWMLETGQVKGGLVGDGGYACQRYMLTPLNNPTTAGDRSYNRAQVLARNCIERTNGMLKRRFPALKYGLRLQLANSFPVIVATVVLHNIVVTLGEEEPEADLEFDRFIAERRHEIFSSVSDAGDVVPTSTASGYPGATGVRQALINNVFT